MLPDSAKLVLLLLISAGCMSTLFTSPSIALQDANMRVLSPEAAQFCKAPRNIATECESSVAPGDNNKDGKTLKCNSLLKGVQKCDSIVKKAYRSINLGGCPFEIKYLTLCEDEWCQNESHEGIKSCRDECAGVRESLTTCVEKRVIDAFRWNGLNKDGTRI